MNFNKITFPIAIFVLIFFSFSLIMSSCTSSEGSNIKTNDPEKAFTIAKSRYDKKDYREAIEDFNYIKLKFSGTDIIDKSQYYLAMSYFKQEEYVLAAYEFEYLLKNYPTSSFAVDARYQLAMCYYNLSPDYRLDQTYTRYAISEFQTFLEIYPDNKLTSEAELRIKELRTKLALKSYQTGMQYLSLENNKSAIIYFDNVLNEYYDTEYADDALLGKIRALINRKKYSEAEVEIKRFEEKFPDSSLRNSLNSLKNKLPS